MDEQMLKEKIARLREQIEEKQKKGYATHKRGETTVGVYDSDLGVKIPVQTQGIVSMSDKEIEAAKSQWEMELYSLKSELRQAQDELLKIECNKPEFIEKRKQEEIRRNEQEQKKQLEERRLEQDERFEDLNKLVEYLRLADMEDLASHLEQMRFAFQKPKSGYVTNEIDLRSEEQSFITKTQTTKKEYREIRRNVVKLTKVATHMAKKYKDLYKLYTSAWEIIQDMEQKGILLKKGSDLARAVNEYFKQPTGKYYFRNKGSMNNYSLEESPNLGYECLSFYRDSNNKYNEDVRKKRI